MDRPVAELEISYRPVELGPHLERVFTEEGGAELQSVPWRSTTAQDRHLDVRIVPISSNGAVTGAIVAYADVTDTRRLSDQLAGAQRELDDAHEELQSAVEELETTNEELQSTNEELETTNEELQSTNEELETMNEELRERSVELNDVNAFLETILTGMGMSVAVLDTHLQVQIWNGQSRELWGLTRDEVEGTSFLRLDFGLPVDALKPGLKACLAGTTEREELVLDAVNRRGKAFRCGVVCQPLDGPGAPSGVIVMMEPRED
jgi:two-component system, chemotaxis family, CheB/CheR fusion protein